MIVMKYALPLKTCTTFAYIIRCVFDVESCRNAGTYSGDRVCIVPSFPCVHCSLFPGTHGTVLLDCVHAIPQFHCTSLPCIRTRGGFTCKRGPVQPPLRGACRLSHIRDTCWVLAGPVSAGPGAVAPLATPKGRL